MDPYLEAPWIWPDVHHGLISGCQAMLNPQLPSNYACRVELRVYISEAEDPGRTVFIPDARIDAKPGRKGSRTRKAEPAFATTEPLIIPTPMDEEVEEAFLKIVHVESQDLIALIEVLSPTNKIRGSAGRRSLMRKRQEVLNTQVHWVEIDLLRDGAPSITSPPLQPCDYRVFISRGDRRLQTRFWPISVRQALPVVPIPLRGKEPEVPLDLGAVLRRAYEHGVYDRSVDYTKPPIPPLEGDDVTWAKELLKPVVPRSRRRE